MKKWLISFAITGTAISTPVTVVKVLMDNNFEFDEKAKSFCF